MLEDGLKNTWIEQVNHGDEEESTSKCEGNFELAMQINNGPTQ